MSGGTPWPIPIHIAGSRRIAADYAIASGVAQDVAIHHILALALTTHWLADQATV